MLPSISPEQRNDPKWSPCLDGVTRVHPHRAGMCQSKRKHWTNLRTGLYSTGVQAAPDPQTRPSELQQLNAPNAPPTSRAHRSFATTSLHPSPVGENIQEKPQTTILPLLFETTDTREHPAKLLSHFGLVPKPTYIHVKTCLASLSSFPLPALRYVQKAQEDGLPHHDPSVRPFFV